MANTALITGASSGIGLELAKIHAEREGNLVLVARNIQKLNELKQEFEAKFDISVCVIQKDLSDSNSAVEVYNELKSNDIQIDFLFNNAGFGWNAPFSLTDFKILDEMVELNVNTLTKLCRLFLPDMLARNSGKILNTASIAAFAPMPYMAVYGATKAYVLSLSDALHSETKNTDVSVTAVCPGPTQSNFMSFSTMEFSPMIKGKKLPSAHIVALRAYNAMLKGKRAIIPFLSNKLMVCAIKFFPKYLTVNIVEKLLGTSKN
ncbi:MAG: SDR family oxidoreductase [Prevotellaceae bacterium]|jgi:short-subunit dehydrogenase|nr:SDR family oxidoreductase [Prevotellaceae bacterium]